MVSAQCRISILAIRSLCKCLIVGLGRYAYRPKRKNVLRKIVKLLGVCSKRAERNSPYTAYLLKEKLFMMTDIRLLICVLRVFVDIPVGSIVQLTKLS